MQQKTAAHVWANACDYFIRIVMVFTTVLSLTYFAYLYKRFELVWLVLLMLVALIIRGIALFVISKHEHDARRN